MKNLKEQLKERISTVESAYKEADRPEVDFSVYPENLRVNRKANYDAIVLVEAARKIERENGFGEIDWNNWDQRKYIPWFLMGNSGSPAGFAFYDSYYGNALATAGSGSRLHVLSEEAASFLGENFPEVWENVQLN